MEHFNSLFNKDASMVKKLLSLHDIKVNLKVDGKPFQVVYNENTDELEFHGRSGDETHIGPIIDDYTRLFSKPINDAIKHVEKNKDVFKAYKFLTFEVIDNVFLLTAIIDKSGKFIEDSKTIKEIAKELDTDVMPTLFEGTLSDEQIAEIYLAVCTNIIPSDIGLVKWVIDLFGNYEYFPKEYISKLSSIEGIVFFFNLDGKIIEYKIVDPAYREKIAKNKEDIKNDRILHSKEYDKMYLTFVNWMEKNAKKYDDNKILSIQHNFINMMSDENIVKELIAICKNLRINKSKTYTIQLDMVIPQLKQQIIENGVVFKQVFEYFIKCFYKQKRILSSNDNGLQKRINSVINNLNYNR